MKKLFTKKNIGGGYALYVAIMLTGVLIIIAYSTANISSRQLVLSTSAADSHTAFYNADAGLECALYADLKEDPTTSAFSTVSNPTGVYASGYFVSCNGQNIKTNTQTVSTVPSQSSVIGGSVNSIFQLNFSKGCAIVKVTKNINGSTLIQSYGYNKCSGSYRLERGVQIEY